MFKQLSRSLRGGKPAGAAAHAPRIPPGQRVYAVGDIHGRLDLVHRMNDLIARDLDRTSPETATLVFLGDYVDRGPDSRGVIDLFVRGPLPAAAVFLRGNHEAALIDFLERPETGLNWRRFGGIETLHSYGLDVAEFRTGQDLDAVARRFAAALPDVHRAFLRDLPLTWSLGGFFFCHAGVRPGVPLARQQEGDLLWIRDEFNESDEDFGQIVVHGHTPTEEPVVRHNRLGIDTGAYITGRLTCAVLHVAGVSFLST